MIAALFLSMADLEIKKQALVTSLRILASAPKSRKQLETKLLEKGYPKSIAVETLDELEKQHILNDKLYAQEVVNRLRVMKRAGRQKIAFELRKKGIPQELRNDLLSQCDEESEIERAKDLARERWERLDSLQTAERKKKI